jgi:hypothetical protein
VDHIAATRGKTPADGLRASVNKPEVRIGSQDFALPGKTITGKLEPDHIVSMDRIARMDGFDRLTPAQQLEILNWPENFTGLSRSANASKQDLPYALWHQHKGSGLMVNPLFTTQMTHMESAVAGRLQTLIDSMVPLP